MVDPSSIDERANLAGTNRLELLTFKLTGAPDAPLFGINVFKVREVIVAPTPIALPGHHACHRGVADIRGSAVPIIDLGAFCECDPGALDGTDEPRILVLTEFNGSHQGFLVHHVDNILALGWDAIEEPPATLSAAHGNLLTAISLLDESRMLLILDVERVIAAVLGAPVESVPVRSPNAPEARLVFFADDSGVARQQVGRILDRMGLAHAEACNGQQALDALCAMADAAERDGSPLSDRLLAIVTDVEMPVMDGYVLTGHIKSDRRFDGVPVMMHSSLSAVENQRLGMEVGADGYVPKLKPDVFSGMLLQLIERARSPQPGTCVTAG